MPHTNGRRRGLEKLGARQRRSKKAQVIARDGYVCHLCGEQIDPEATGDGAFSLDHIVPDYDGGTNHVNNLAPAHQGCNRRRDRTPLELARDLARLRARLQKEEAA